jgi:hypothetical protein
MATTSFYYIEVSDLANTWTEKFCIEATEATAVRRAKNEIGWNGLRCNRYDRGDAIELRPRGQNRKALIQRESA